jgi:acetyl esterase
MSSEPTVDQLEKARADYLNVVISSADEWAHPNGGYPTSRLIELDPTLGGVTVEDVSIDGPHGPVPIRRYIGSDDPISTLMWVHGGAFVFGSLEMPEAHWVSLTLAAHGVEVFSVDYRKALDGIHYPVPYDDLHTAWRWLTTNSSVSSPLSGKIHLGGASAGAALSAGLVVQLRDVGERLPDSVALVYPIVHPRLPEMTPELASATASILENGSFNAHIIDGMSYNFAGSLSAFHDPHAFAGLGDPSGFPPTLIINSELDILRASGETFARQLENAHVQVTWVTEPGSLHGQLDEPENPAGIRSLERLISWLAQQAPEHTFGEGADST